MFSINKFLQDNKINISPIPVSSTSMDVLKKIINDKLDEIDEYFKNQRTKTEQKIDEKFYAEYSSIVADLAYKDIEYVLFNICEFIKKHDKEPKFSSCGISKSYNCESAYGNDEQYNALYQKINKCLYKTFRYSCSDLFKHYTSVRGISFKPEHHYIGLKSTEDSSSIKIKFFANEFCRLDDGEVVFNNSESTKVSDFKQIMQSTYNLSATEAETYKYMVGDCANDFMGKFIKSCE